MESLRGADCDLFWFIIVGIIDGKAGDSVIVDYFQASWGVVEEGKGGAAEEGVDEELVGFEGYWFWF